MYIYKKAVQIGVVLSSTVPSDIGINFNPMKKQHYPTPPNTPLIINLFLIYQSFG